MQWHHLTGLTVITSAVTGTKHLMHKVWHGWSFWPETDEAAAGRGSRGFTGISWCSFLKKDLIVTGPVALGRIIWPVWSEPLPTGSLRLTFCLRQLRDTNRSRDGWEEAADVNKTFWKCLNLYDSSRTRSGLLRPVCLYQPLVCQLVQCPQIQDGNPTDRPSDSTETLNLH